VHGDLFRFGVEVKQVRARLDDRAFRGFVEVFAYDGPAIRIHEAPLEKHLKAGRPFAVRITAPGCRDLALINNGTWQHLTRNGEVFEGTALPRQGRLQVSGKYAEGNTFHTILQYAVE
jgi:hypothetical protein